jgi:hypothetical protein
MVHPSALSILGRCVCIGAFSLSLLAVLPSCEQAEKARNTVSAVEAMAEAGENLEKEAVKADAKTAARRAKGDTLALPYKELQAYLPQVIGDYQPVGELEGSTMSMTGMSYSSCARSYQSGSDENLKTIKISLIDYNGAGAIYAGATAMLGANFQMEDEQQRVQALNLGIPEVTALETFRKKDLQASLIAGIGQRFYLSIEATNQPDATVVEAAAKAIDLRKLGAL